MKAPIQLDLHVTRFNYPDTEPDQVFDKVAEIAATAERSGFSSLSVMDHLHQIPGMGPETDWMLEGSTMLAGIAARTQSIALGLLVGGVTYRNPALHAKITTTIDVISGGRAYHGLGGAWFENEHRAFGFEFPPLGERLDRLGEALEISRAMFTKDEATFKGKHFQVDGAINNPKPIRGDIPIVIGGSGRRRTLRMVAEHADGCNLFGSLDETRDLLEVLAAHCETVDRDPAEITKTRMAVLAIAPDHEGAQAKLEAMRQAGLSEERLAMMVLAGDAEEVAEQAQAFVEAGVDGMTLMLPDVHDLESVALAGEALGPVFASPVA
jgi:F420-dependent oxidoreductase-like protein